MGVLERKRSRRQQQGSKFHTHRWRPAPEAGLYNPADEFITLPKRDAARFITLATGERVRTPRKFWDIWGTIADHCRQGRPCDGGARYLSRTAGVAPGTFIKYRNLGERLGMGTVEYRPGGGEGRYTNLIRCNRTDVWALGFSRRPDSKSGTYDFHGFVEGSVKSSKHTGTGPRACAERRSVKVELTAETEPAEAAVQGFRNGFYERCRSGLSAADAKWALWQLIALGYGAALLAYFRHVGNAPQFLERPRGFLAYTIATFARTLNSAKSAPVARGAESYGGEGSGKFEQIRANPAPARERMPRLANAAEGLAAIAAAARAGSEGFGAGVPNGEVCEDEPADAVSWPAGASPFAPEAAPASGNPLVPPLAGPADTTGGGSPDEPGAPERPDYYAGLAARGIEPARVMQWLGPDRLAVLGAIRTEADIDALAARYRARSTRAPRATRPAGRAAPAAPNCRLCADTGLCGYTERDVTETAELAAAIETDGCWLCSCKAGRAIAADAGAE